MNRSTKKNFSTIALWTFYALFGILLPIISVANWEFVLTNIAPNILACAIALIVLYLCFPFALCGGILLLISLLAAWLLVPSPAVPEVQYAEFPVEIVFEIEGERHEVSDTFVCKYNGISQTFITKKREWVSYFKNTGNYHLPLCYSKSSKGLVCFYPGNAEYFMLGKTLEGKYQPGDFYIDSYHTWHKTPEELEEELGIKIISTKFSEPLEENKCEYRTIDKIRRFISFEY